MRVWELAAELHVDAATIVHLIRPHDAYVTSHLATVPPQAVDAIRADPPAPQPGQATRANRRRANRNRDSEATWQQQAHQEAVVRWATRRCRPGPARITFERATTGDHRDDWDDDGDSEGQLLWSTSDIARHYQVSAATVRSWVARGHLTPTGTRGVSHAFDRDDVQDALAGIAARRNRTATPATGRPPCATTEDAHTSAAAPGLTDLADLAALLSGSFRAHTRTPVEALARLAASHPKTTVTAAEAAKLLGLSPATIRAWGHRGHLTPVRRTNGPDVRFRLEDLHAAATRPRKRS